MKELMKLKLCPQDPNTIGLSILKSYFILMSATLKTKVLKVTKKLKFKKETNSTVSHEMAAHKLALLTAKHLIVTPFS